MLESYGLKKLVEKRLKKTSSLSMVNDIGVNAIEIVNDTDSFDRTITGLFLKDKRPCYWTVNINTFAINDMESLIKAFDNFVNDIIIGVAMFYYNQGIIC